MKLLSFTLVCATLAFASGTVTPKAARCAVSTIEGTVSKLDVPNRKFSVAGPNNTSREFKIAPDTLFRIPGATPQQLKDAPLSKVSANARVKVSYCTRDGSPVEVKVER
jgi:hypothetical protein